MGLLCHGKKLLDMDNDELEDKEEGLCLQDDFLSSDEVAELIAKFTDASVHLCLYLDSCFDGDCPPGTVNAPSWRGHAPRPHGTHGFGPGLLQQSRGEPQ